MRCCSLGLAAVAALAVACGDGEGTSGPCAFGGALTDCPDAARTAEAACTRLVECGALEVEGEDDNDFDWGVCVDAIDRLTEDRFRLVVDCIAAATCDELRVDGFCFELGQ